MGPKVAVPLIVLLTMSFTSAFADTSVSDNSSTQDQLLPTHFKIGFLSLDLSKKQILEYLIIAIIPLIIVIVIASSVRSKSKKNIRK